MTNQKFSVFILSVILLYPQFNHAEARKNSGSAGKTAIATFAGGCFWCMQGPFDKTSGVLKTVVGYTGGSTTNPSYKEVTSQSTGHYESIQVTYDPAVVRYETLLDIFWHNIDPTDAGGQFCDRGSSYRSAIFYHSDSQKRAAERSKAMIGERLSVVTPIVGSTKFYPAEEYHQNYYKKNPIRYKFYRSRCGRDSRLEELWGR